MVAMEKQMVAEREKRSLILDSEGKRESEINTAEGVKQSSILTSEGEMQQKINDADGEAQAIKLRAIATAEALDKIGKSLNTPDGEKAANLDVAKKYINEFGKLAKESNTLIIPSDTNNVNSMIASAMSVLDKVKK
jgi:regulator of protease activity HflC (stomatin/prohibitin superfamily)